MNIFLIGFMGAGKSSVGKILAKKCSLKFYDTDDEIEKKMKMSVADIFKKFGESKFREIEKEVLNEISKKNDNSVIATGGGTVLSERNVLSMKESGKLVFLDVSFEKVMSRIMSDDSRPLLHKVSFGERRSIYENCADLIVDANFSVESACSQIMCALNQKQKFYLIAGPCVVESEEQINLIAEKVKLSGATHLRGGAFKLRTAAESFCGLRELGLKLLVEAKKKTGLPIVSEITKISQLEKFEDVDVVQVGARNAQNFELLKELGKTRKTILLKRGFSMTLKEFVLSVQYVINGGNTNIILCERGIATFENYTRSTLDISAVPILKKLSGLPVIVDPSHASGRSWIVRQMCFAAIAAGADGLMIEVHHDKKNALCDGQQSITPNEFAEIVSKISEFKNIF